MRSRLARRDAPRRLVIGLGIALLGVLAVGTSASAGVTAPIGGPGERDTACTNSALQRFGYWEGEWVVKDGRGTVIGTNSVTRALGGCAYHEHWASRKGELGESFTTYDRLDGTWHELYMGSGGYVLALRGAFVGDTLVLTTLPHPSASDHDVQVVERWKWEPLDNRRLRQTGAISSDGGVTWRTKFMELYERAAR